MKQFGIKEAAAFLSECDGYLIYCHASPDGDTLGSAIGLALILRKLGKRAFAFSVDGIPNKLSFLPTGDIFLEAEPEDLSDYTLISVDVAGPRMLGNARNKSFVLSIDHHKVNTIDCENLLVMSDRIACGEIIFKIMDELEVSLDKDIACALYSAICSDSGGFRYDATKPETHIMAARLIETGIDFASINRYLFESKTPEQIALTKTAYNNLELLCDGKFAIVAINEEQMKACNAIESDFDCINSIPREISGVLASAVIRQKSDGVKVSMRSNADIDVAELAKKQGGGGHYHAAGFTYSGDFNSALELTRKIFTELSL